MSIIDEHGNIHDGDSGRFTGHVQAEGDPGAVLSGDAPLADPEALRDRLRILRSGQRYVPARALGSVDLSDPRDFWAAEYETAEFADPTVAYPKMPDDFTPKRSEGRSLHGLRRTHRATYTGEQVDLLMPSVTSVRAYSQTVNGAFDIPVQATDKSGRQVTAWVRCSRTANGRWMTTGLGFEGDDNAIVSEAVAAVLESRRPRHALKTVGNLLAARRDRIAGGGIAVHPVRSSWIKGFGYSDDDGMTVMETLPSETKKGLTRLGKQYGYRTSRAEYEAALHSASPGAAFSQLIKGKPRMDLGQCSRCGMVYAVAHTHVCRSPHTRPDGVHNQALQRWAAIDGARDVIEALNSTGRKPAAG